MLKRLSAWFSPLCSLALLVGSPALLRAQTMAESCAKAEAFMAQHIANPQDFGASYSARATLEQIHNNLSVAAKEEKDFSSAQIRYNVAVLNSAFISELYRWLLVPSQAFFLFSREGLSQETALNIWNALVHVHQLWAYGLSTKANPAALIENARASLDLISGQRVYYDTLRYYYDQKVAWLSDPAHTWRAELQWSLN